MAYGKDCGKAPEKAKGFQKAGKVQMKSQGSQKLTLMAKEGFLRRLQNKQGKGTAYHDSTEDYYDQ